VSYEFGFWFLSALFIAVFALDWCGRINKRSRIGISLSAKTTGDQMKINGQITTAQQATVTAQFEDAAGVVVPVQGIPAWTVDNPAIATVAAAADGMSAVIAGVAAGAAVVTVTAEGDPTPGVDTITGEVDVIVVADEATQVVLTFGTPVPKA
jgi:hypothetical protein